MADAAHSTELIQQSLVFLGAACIAAPAFRLLGLSAILGYLVAGVVIGPSVLNFFSDPGTLVGIAELGVVMFLFVIGLELKLSQLVSMRRDIGVLGGAQMGLTVLVVILAMQVLGYGWTAAFVVAIAMALSATSIALQILEERGHLPHVYGRKTFAVLLFQDISVVPILAIVPLLAVGPATGSAGSQMTSVALAVAAVAAIVLTGRYLLNPFFRLLAKAGGREVMTASALLVVLGAAWLMSKVGMSMALGAFLAGLLLAESNFRHELEADIEPFRGLLLGLFFMSVGMLIDVRFVWANILPLIGWTFGIILLKFGIVYGIARADKADHLTALRAASVLTPAGEFSFVILPLATGAAILTADDQRFFTAVAAVTMLVGPALSKAIELLVARIEQDTAARVPERTEDFSEARGSVLVIGFGRFGQQVNQMLLTAGSEVTVIDNDIEMIQAAARFGFKVYFGDGARLDVLRAAGAENARIICVCIDKAETAVIITELLKANFPLAKVHVRAYDRRHALELMAHEPHLVVRETFDSALSFGHSTLEALGLTTDEADQVRDDVRRRDMQRLLLQQREGIMGGTSLTYKQAVTPQPLSEPKVKSVALSAETQVAISQNSAP